MNRRKFTLKTENTVGVLRRVCGVFSRKGYNIDTLHVEPCPDDPEFSNMTITFFLDEAKTTELMKMLKRLYDVTAISHEM